MAEYRLQQHIPPKDDDFAEAWSREIAGLVERDVHGVNAFRWRRVAKWNWQVDVWVMAHVRDVPLEGELRRRIAEALRGVPGVIEAKEGDREFWIVRGEPNGGALVTAVAGVVDELADEIRAYLDSRETH